MVSGFQLDFSCQVFSSGVRLVLFTWRSWQTGLALRYNASEVSPISSAVPRQCWLDTHDWHTLWLLSCWRQRSPSITFCRSCSPLWSHSVRQDSSTDLFMSMQSDQSRCHYYGIMSRIQIAKCGWNNYWRSCLKTSKSLRVFALWKDSVRSLRWSSLPYRW